MNILVPGSGNTARSILLEAVFETPGADRVRAYSAGTSPAGAVQARRDAADPAAKAGAGHAAALRAAYDVLHRRVQALLDLPAETMSPAEPAAQLKRIGEIA